MLNELRDKVVIITGAASGIGRASADIFAREGAMLVLADIDELNGLATARSVTSAGGKAIFIRCDVTKESEIASLTQSALEEFGALHAAVNNAGGGTPGKFVDAQTSEEWLTSLQLNIVSIGLCMKHQIPIMRRQGGGAIVNMTSVCGLVGIPGLGPYSAAKAGIMALTRVAAAEFSKDGIRINALAPGMTGGKRRPKENDGEVNWVKLFRVPNRRVGEFHEVAELAAFLCSSRASIITGATLTADGGLTAV